MAVQHTHAQSSLEPIPPPPQQDLVANSLPPLPSLSNMTLQMTRTRKSLNNDLASKLSTLLPRTLPDFTSFAETHPWLACSTSMTIKAALTLISLLTTHLLPPLLLLLPKDARPGHAPVPPSVNFWVRRPPSHLTTLPRVISLGLNDSWSKFLLTFTTVTRRTDILFQ